jgi:hypothetical protein
MARTVRALKKLYSTVLLAFKNVDKKGLDPIPLAIEFVDILGMILDRRNTMYFRSTRCIFLTCSAVKVAIESFHLLWVLIKCTARRVILSQFGWPAFPKGCVTFMN